MGWKSPSCWTLEYQFRDDISFTHCTNWFTRFCVSSINLNHIITDTNCCRLSFMWDAPEPSSTESAAGVLSFSCFLPYPSLHFSFSVSSAWFWLWLRHLAPVAVAPFDWAVEGWRRSPARALGTGWFGRSPGRSRRIPTLTDRQLSSAGDTISTFSFLKVKNMIFIEKGPHISREVWQLLTFQILQTRLMILA